MNTIRRFFVLSSNSLVGKSAILINSKLSFPTLTMIHSESYHSYRYQNMGMEDFNDSKTDPVVTHGRSWTVPDLRRKVYN